MGSKQPLVMSEVFFLQWTPALLSSALTSLRLTPGDVFFPRKVCTGVSPANHAADLWWQRINHQVGGLSAWGKNHITGWGMLVQSLSVLDEGNITERGLNTLCSTPRSFASLCCVAHWKAIPAQRIQKGAVECRLVYKIPNASAQAAMEEPYRADTAQRALNRDTQHQQCLKRKWWVMSYSMDSKLTHV